MSGTGRAKKGFTLVEVAVAMGLAAMATGGIFQGLVLSKGLNQANEQRVVAFGLCLARLEEVKGMGYEEIVAAEFPEEQTIPMTHLGGSQHVGLSGVRNTVVRDLTNPDRKEVEVQIDWTYRGRALTEHVTGLVYPK